MGGSEVQTVPELEQEAKPVGVRLSKRQTNPARRPAAGASALGGH